MKDKKSKKTGVWLTGLGGVVIFYLLMTLLQWQGHFWDFGLFLGSIFFGLCMAIAAYYAQGRRK